MVEGSSSSAPRPAWTRGTSGRLPRDDRRHERRAHVRGRDGGDDHEPGFRDIVHRAPPAPRALLDHAGHPVAGPPLRAAAPPKVVSGRLAARSAELEPLDEARCAAAGAARGRGRGRGRVPPLQLPQRARAARGRDRGRGDAGRLRHDQRGHLTAVPGVRAVHDRLHERLRGPADRALPRAAGGLPGRGRGAGRPARDDVQRRGRERRAGGAAPGDADAVRAPPPACSGGCGPATWTAGPADHVRRGRRRPTSGSSPSAASSRPRPRHPGRRVPARADGRRPHDRGRRRLDRPPRPRRRLPRGPAQRRGHPGPAAYGTGGTEPTLTDANVVLGRIDPDRFLGGEMRSTGGRRGGVGAAEGLGMSLLEAAEGIVTIANANMAGAIRSRTIQKGHDPREFTLVAFGGGGPLAAAEVRTCSARPRSSCRRSQGSPPPQGC